MGLRVGAYATVFDVQKKKDGITSLRIAVSYKKKDETTYTQTFSGYVSCFKDYAEKALALNPKDRIKITMLDVTSTYNKETKKEYTNYTIEFEPVDNGTNQQQSAAPAQNTPAPAPTMTPPAADMGYGGEELPF